MKNNAFSLDLSGSNVLSRHDRVAFRIAQPLRVTSGGLALHLPVAYDYATLATTFAARQISATGDLEGTELSYSQDI